jgi:hypothetical protein
MKGVTRNGDCIEVDYNRMQPDVHRDGVLHLFKIMDAAHNRGERLLQIYCPDELRQAVNTCDYKVERRVGFNVIRRAFDSGELSFNAPYDKHLYKELKLQESDFENQAKATDPEIMQFILHKAYWLGYKLNPNIAIYPLDVEDSLDFDYLGVDRSDIQRIVWRLTGQKLFGGKHNSLDRPRVTEKLVSLYESSHGTKLHHEYVFPKGTQWEAYKAVRQILQSAKHGVFIVDNYMSDDILDTLASLPAKIKIRLLTSKVEPDFNVAVNRFRSQYPQLQLEVRRQKTEIHDRAIAVDGKEWYALGHSIRNIGAKLSLINKLEDSNAIQKLQTTLEQVWSSATSFP